MKANANELGIETKIVEFKERLSIMMELLQEEERENQNYG